MNCIYNGITLSYRTGDALYSVGYMLYTCMNCIYNGIPLSYRTGDAL
jgi:hypothetical protein